MTEISDEERVRAEAAAFRRLVDHLQKRSDVQNLDLMNMAGFCRNCLANWYRDAANASGVPLTKEESRESIYGMPYEAWKDLHQKEADEAQKVSFAQHDTHK